MLSASAKLNYQRRHDDVVQRCLKGHPVPEPLTQRVRRLERVMNEAIQTGHNISLDVLALLCLPFLMEAEAKAAQAKEEPETAEPPNKKGKVA